MKTLLFVAALAAALIAPPAVAQLGPAGVPGAPGLAETDPSVKPPPAPVAAPAAVSSTPSAPQRNHVTVKCGKNKSAKKCKAGQSTKRKTPPADCSKSSDAARCLQHQKAWEICKDKLGREHSQCLRDNLAPKK